MTMQYRKINYLPVKANSLKEAETVSPFRPENVVLIEKKKIGQNTIRKFDLGRFCFTRRDKNTVSTQNKSTGQWEFRVDPSSLRKERRAFIGSTISYLREQQTSETDIIDKALKATRFLSFIDEHLEEDEWPYNKTSGLLCYQKYVERLIHSSRLPKGAKDSLSSSSAGKYGSIARQMLEAAFKISARDIERKVPSILHAKSSSDTAPAAISDRRDFVFACLSIFEHLHEAILNGKPFPWKIDLSNAGINESFLWRGVTEKKPSGIYWPHYYGPNGELKTEKEFRETLDSFGATKPSDPVVIDGAGKSARATIIRAFLEHGDYLNRINTDTTLYESHLYRSYDLAVFCFWNCFIAATSLNHSVASNLQFGSEEYIPQRGYVFSGLKVRAGNKLVHAEFQKHFLKYFKKFKELRAWAVSQLEQEPPVWFFQFDASPQSETSVGHSYVSAQRIIKRDSYRKIPARKFSSLKSVFKLINHPIRYISTSELRQGVSFDWFKLSGGDAVLVAQKLGNTVETVQKAYAGVNDEDAYPELVDYYGKVIERVKSVGQSSPGIIPVRVLEEGSDNLPVGNCDNSSFVTPKKASQFSEGAPDPDCARSETCLFCEFFAIHVDRSGLKKLLSFRELFPLIKERTGSIDRYISVFSPIEGRIDEILTHIRETYPEKTDMLDDIAEEVSEGDIDEFWEHHFNFLIELGYAQ